jgi:hypothetical protein
LHSITSQSNPLSFSEILHLTICLVYEDQLIFATSVLYLPVGVVLVALVALVLAELVLVLVVFEPVVTFLLLCDAWLQLIQQQMMRFFLSLYCSARKNVIYLSKVASYVTSILRIHRYSKLRLTQSISSDVGEMKLILLLVGRHIFTIFPLVILLVILKVLFSSITPHSPEVKLIDIAETTKCIVHYTRKLVSGRK